MRQQILLLSVLGALTGSALAACSRAPLESTLPLTGTYVLQRADGAPLPFLFSASSSERYELVSERLLFEPQGKVIRERTIRLAHPTTGRDTTYTHRLEQEYRLRGHVLEIGSFQPCPSNANCVGREMGTVSGAQLEVQSSIYRTGAEPPRLLYVQQ